MSVHRGDDVGHSARVGADGFLAGGDPECGEHCVPLRHGGVDGHGIEHIGADHFEPIVVQRKRVRLPGDRGDPMSAIRSTPACARSFCTAMTAPKTP